MPRLKQSSWQSRFSMLKTLPGCLEHRILLGLDFIAQALDLHFHVRKSREALQLYMECFQPCALIHILLCSNTSLIKPRLNFMPLRTVRPSSCLILSSSWPRSMRSVPALSGAWHSGQQNRSAQRRHRLEKTPSTVTRYLRLVGDGIRPPAIIVPA
jgi:hypothetical protein